MSTDNCFVDSLKWKMLANRYILGSGESNSERKPWKLGFLLHLYNSQVLGPGGRRGTQSCLWCPLLHVTAAVLGSPAMSKLVSQIHGNQLPNLVLAGLGAFCSWSAPRSCPRPCRPSPPGGPTNGHSCTLSLCSEGSRIPVVGAASRLIVFPLLILVFSVICLLAILAKQTGRPELVLPRPCGVSRDPRNQDHPGARTPRAPPSPPTHWTIPAPHMLAETSC